MGRHTIPLWLRQLATDIDDVLEEHDGWSEVRAEEKAWSAHYYQEFQRLPDRIGKNNIVGPLEGRVLDRRMRRNMYPNMAALELIPLPRRRLTLREQCALLAAIHDACGGGERIDSWETTQKTTEQGRGASSFFAYFHLQKDVIDGGLSKADEKRLRRMLKGVEQHLTGGRRTNAPAPPIEVRRDDESASQRLLRVYTGSMADDRIKQAAKVVEDDALTINEKLEKIDELIRVPVKASGEELARLVGGTKQAVWKTNWWQKNRKGEKANEIGRRRDHLLKKGAQYEEKPRDDE